jgi:excisionase family DNA binding protein
VAHQGSRQLQTTPASQMATQELERERLVPPGLSPEEVAHVRAAQRLVMVALDRSKAATIAVEADDGRAAPVVVPPKVLKVIGQVLGLMAQGRPVLMMPEKQELSTVEAAAVLNVSRPFVIKEIEAGRLKHRMVGSHRRVPFDALSEYQRKMQAEREAALDCMAANARELGLDY